MISLWSKGLPGDQGLSGSALQLSVSVPSERGPGVGRPHGCALTAQVWTREGQRPHGRSALMISATFIQTWCRRRTTLWLVFGFFQIPLLVLGSRQTFTVKQPVLWSRVWGDSWPPTSPTRRSTSSHLTMLLFCLRYIYLTVKIHNRNDVIGGDSNVWAATFEFILYVVWRYLIFLLIRKRQCSLQIAVRGPLADQTRPTDNRTNDTFLGVPKLFHARREMLGIIQL